MGIWVVEGRCTILSIIVDLSLFVADSRQSAER